MVLASRTQVSRWSGELASPSTDLYSSSERPANDAPSFCWPIPVPASRFATRRDLSSSLNNPEKMAPCMRFSKGFGTSYA
jgi:hypothetical protein